MLAFFLLLFTCCPLITATRQHNHKQNNFDTRKHYGNSSVEWTRCGHIAKKQLECATIFVPMDHFAMQFKKSLNFSIPLMRLLSPKGTRTILLNPGGPGESGLELLQTDGAALSTIVGEDFHLLGFDPRGVAASRPLASCYYPANSDCLSEEKTAMGPFSPSDDSTTDIHFNSGDYFAWNENYARACVEVTGQHTQHINTPQTAADMNDILEAIGEAEMNFLGYSYGTTLGATYAQLFPQRVRRMVLDGIISTHRHYTDSWTTNEQDADAVFRSLLEECFKAKESCALARDFSSVDDMQANLTRSIDLLKDNPVPVYINASAYGVLRDVDIRKEGIFRRLYEPIRWPLMMISLHALVHGDFETPYKHFFGGILPGPERTKPTSSKSVAYTQTDNSFDIVMYSDTAPKDQATRQRLSRKEIVDAYKPISSYLVHDANDQKGFLDNAWRYGRAHSFVPSKAVVTKFPILLLSTSLDPVTPLSEAKAMNKILQGSVLVEQESIGHTASSMPSRCTALHMRRYFNDGILPPTGATCEKDRPYFPSPDDDNWAIMSPEDAQLTSALEALASDLGTRGTWSAGMRRH